MAKPTRLVDARVLTDTHEHEGQPVERGAVIKVPADLLDVFPGVLERVRSTSIRHAKGIEDERPGGEE